MCESLSSCQSVLNSYFSLLFFNLCSRLHTINSKNITTDFVISNKIVNLYFKLLMNKLKQKFMFELDIFYSSEILILYCTSAQTPLHQVHVTQSLKSTPVVLWLSYSPLDLRFAGSNPAGVDGFFQSIKILSMTSFGREVQHGFHVIDLRHVKEPQAKTTASEQNLSDFSRSL